MSLLDDENVLIDNSGEAIFKKIGVKIDDFIKKFNFNPNSTSYSETTTIYMTEPTSQSLSYDIPRPCMDIQIGEDSVKVYKEISSFSYTVFQSGSQLTSSFNQWISAWISTQWVPAHYKEYPETFSIAHRRYKNRFAKLIKQKDYTSPYGWFVTVLGDGLNYPILLSDCREECLPEYLIFKKYDSYLKSWENEKSEKQLIVLQNCNPGLYENLRNHEYLTPMTLQEYVLLKNKCKYEY